MNVLPIPVYMVTVVILTEATDVDAIQDLPEKIAKTVMIL